MEQGSIIVAASDELGTLAWQNEHIELVADATCGGEWVFSSVTGERALLSGTGRQLDFHQGLAFVARDHPTAAGQPPQAEESQWVQELFSYAAYRKPCGEVFIKGDASTRQSLAEHLTRHEVFKVGLMPSPTARRIELKLYAFEARVCGRFWWSCAGVFSAAGFGVGEGPPPERVHPQEDAAIGPLHRCPRHLADLPAIGAVRQRPRGHAAGAPQGAGGADDLHHRPRRARRSVGVW